MLLTVRHTTTYVFDTPMRFVAQSHRLTPANNGSQKVRSWSVTSEGATFGAAFTDGAGDRVTTMTAQGPVDRIEILVEGGVETVDTTGVLRDHREIISPVCYLQGTAATTPTGALLELVAKTVEAARGTDLARAHRFNEVVGEAIAYVPGATHAHTTAAEAVELGQGVCQDHGVDIRAAALQFCLAHPTVAATIPGSSTPERARQNAELLRAPIPAAFWRNLREIGVLPEDAPTPA